MYAPCRPCLAGTTYHAICAQRRCGRVYALRALCPRSRSDEGGTCRCFSRRYFLLILVTRVSASALSPTPGHAYPDRAHVVLGECPPVGARRESTFGEPRETARCVGSYSVARGTIPRIHRHATNRAIVACFSRHPPPAVLATPLTLRVPSSPFLTFLPPVFFGLFVVLNNQLRGWYTALAPSSVTSFLPGTFVFPKSQDCFPIHD